VFGAQRTTGIGMVSGGRTVGAVDQTPDRVFDEVVGRSQSVHRRYGQWRFGSDQAELFGRIIRVHL
jgi:hypothetical protein